MGHYEETRDLFHRWARDKQGFYDARKGGPLRHPLWTRRMLRLALAAVEWALIRAPEARRLADLGCGRGDLTVALAARCPGLDRIFACDFSLPTARLAQGQAGGLPIGFVAADIRRLPLPDRAVDVAVCVNVLHHVHRDDFAAAVDEVARVASRFLVLEMKNRDNPFYRYLHKSVEETRVFPTTRRELCRLLDRLGFRLVHGEGVFKFYLLSPKVVLLFERRPEGGGVLH